MKADDRTEGNEDKIELLKKLILNGSPISKAVALTLLDQETKGKVSEELKHLLKNFKDKNLLVTFPNIVFSSYRVYRHLFKIIRSSK